MAGTGFDLGGGAWTLPTGGGVEQVLKVEVKVILALWAYKIIGPRPLAGVGAG